MAATKDPQPWLVCSASHWQSSCTTAAQECVKSPATFHTRMAWHVQYLQLFETHQREIIPFWFKSPPSKCTLIHQLSMFFFFFLRDWFITSLAQLDKPPTLKNKNVIYNIFPNVFSWRTSHLINIKSRADDAQRRRSCREEEGQHQHGHTLVNTAL